MYLGLAAYFTGGIYSTVEMTYAIFAVLVVLSIGLGFGLRKIFPTPPIIMSGLISFLTLFTLYVVVAVAYGDLRP